MYSSLGFDVAHYRVVSTSFGIPYHPFLKIGHVPAYETSLRDHRHRTTPIDSNTPSTSYIYPTELTVLTESCTAKDWALLSVRALARIPTMAYIAVC